MRRTGTLTAALTIIAALAGCGGHRYAGPRHAGHPCNPADYFQQCALDKQAPPRGLKAAPGGVFAQGVDFAWSCPSPAGRGFGASYLSTDSSKNWSRGCVNAYHAAGAGTVAVWETGASEATAGYNAGFNDAFRARGQARALGMSDNRPISYAIDCDCSGASVDSYFRGADAGSASVLHVSLAQGASETDAYGGYSPLAYLCSRGLVGHQNWQTYAWSGGRWLPASCAPLEQYLNDGAVDYDRAIAADYGQWPYNVAPPPRVRCLHKPYPTSHSCGMVRYGYSVTVRDRAKVLARLAEHHCSARVHPSYCRGWQHSLAVDDRNLSDFVRLYG